MLQAGAHTLIKLKQGRLMQGRRGDARGMHQLDMGGTVTQEQQGCLRVGQLHECMQELGSRVNVLTHGMLVAVGRPAKSGAQQLKLAATPHKSIDTCYESSLLLRYWHCL